jgi:hypothetical protein
MTMMWALPCDRAAAMSSVAVGRLVLMTRLKAIIARRRRGRAWNATQRRQALEMAGSRDSVGDGRRDS